MCSASRLTWNSTRANPYLSVSSPSIAFVNIGINVDSEKQSLIDYVALIKRTIPAKQHFPMAWRRAKGHSDNFGALSSNPTHFLLDPDHKLVTRRNGVFKADNWDELWTSLQ